MFETNFSKSGSASPSGVHNNKNNGGISMPAVSLLQNQAIEKKHINTTGLPNNLKDGIEQLSGLSMDDIKVHYNSDKPAQFQALAYAHGNNIHLGPGQERHLPHEAWHVVQQKQGRAGATHQMKGNTPVNTDQHLEHEADQMGMKAFQFTAPASGSPDMPQQSPNSPNISYQFYQKIETGDQESLFHKDLYNPDKKLGRRSPSINWVLQAEIITELLKDVRENLNENRNTVQGEQEKILDSQIAQLERWDKKIDRLIVKGNHAVETFNNDGGSVSSGNILSALRSKSINFLAEIQEVHYQSESRIDAIGRAHDVEDINIVDVNLAKHPVNNEFIEGITIAGSMLTNKKIVQKDSLSLKPTSTSLYILGKEISPEIEDKLKQGLLAQVDDNTDPTGSPGPQDFTRPFTAQARGLGQRVAMKNTNARGYAWLTDDPYWNKVDWEWLHIRGAGLGGTTGPENLVLGNKDSNTHMMPFEENLRILSTKLKDNKGDLLRVKWSIEQKKAPNRYKFETIGIEWSYLRKDKALTSGSAKFKPLEGKAVITKTEVSFLQKALETEREKSGFPSIAKKVKTVAHTSPGPQSTFASNYLTPQVTPVKKLIVNSAAETDSDYSSDADQRDLSEEETPQFTPVKKLIVNSPAETDSDYSSDADQRDLSEEETPQFTPVKKLIVNSPAETDSDYSSDADQRDLSEEEPPQVTPVKGIISNSPAADSVEYFSDDDDEANERETLKNITPRATPVKERNLNSPVMEVIPPKATRAKEKIKQPSFDLQSSDEEEHIEPAGKEDIFPTQPEYKFTEAENYDIIKKTFRTHGYDGGSTLKLYKYQYLSILIYLEFITSAQFKATVRNKKYNKHSTENGSEEMYERWTNGELTM